MTHMMMDDSFLTTSQIESRLREIECHLKAIKELEKVVGEIGLDYETAELALKDKRREWAC